MKKSNAIIIITILIVLIGVLFVFVILKDNKNNSKKDSLEKKTALQTFQIVRLSSDGKEYYLSGLKKEKNVSGTLVIPDEIDNIPVTQLIDVNDFSSFSKVSIIKIGKNISWIGNRINLNVDESSYGEMIFVNCTNLVEIVVDENNKKYSSKDGVLFNKDQSLLLKYPCSKSQPDDTKLNLYEIPSNVVRLYNHSFYQSKSLKKVVFNNELKNVGIYAFSNCDLLDTVIMNNGLEVIESHAFNNCSKLTKIDLPIGLKEVKAQAFNHIQKINIFLPSTLTLFEPAQFVGASEVTIRTSSDNVSNVAHMIEEKFQLLAVTFTKKYPELSTFEAIKKSIIIEDIN